jgi:hypothetical protein
VCGGKGVTVSFFLLCTVPLKRLADEVMEVLKQRVGHTTFFQAYETVRSQVMELRRQRRAQRQRLPVVNPQLAAQQKIRRNRSKSKRRRRGKKRKLFSPHWQPVFSSVRQILTTTTTIAANQTSVTASVNPNSKANSDSNSNSNSTPTPIEFVDENNNDIPSSSSSPPPPKRQRTQ